METIGASHSAADPRQSSSVIMSLRWVEYSRMRPQPVQVRLQVWSGSSCKTKANLGVRRTLCLTICRTIFAVNASGNRIRDNFSFELPRLPAVQPAEHGPGWQEGDPPEVIPV